MILNNAADIQRGSIPTNYVYHGDILIWQRGTPPIDPWDKYEAEHGDKITIVRLDANGNETNDIYYAPYGPTGDRFDYAISYLRNQYNSDRTARFNLYYGDRIPMEDSAHTGYSWNEFVSGLTGKDNISAFRFPHVYSSILHAFYYDYSMRGFPNLKTVVMPEDCINGSDHVYQIPDYFIYGSSVESVVFRNYSTTISYVGSSAFSSTSLRSIELPYYYNSSQYVQFSPYAFFRCSNITITLNNNTDDIPGAPWGATNATVVWKGEH